MKINFRIKSSFILLVTLTGCGVLPSVGPDYEEPKMQLPENWTSKVEGEEYGKDRLLEWLLSQRGLSAAELQDELLAEITNFHRGDNNDDATVLVLARA